MLSYTVSHVRSWETTPLTHQNTELSHNFSDTSPLKPFPQRLTSENNHVIRINVCLTNGLYVISSLLSVEWHGRAEAKRCTTGS